MLCKVVGEVFTLRVETAMEATYPGELEQLKKLLRDLWKTRCSFAHADLNANMANVQITFNAPSLAISQHAQLTALLSRYESQFVATLPP